MALRRASAQISKSLASSTLATELQQLQGWSPQRIVSPTGAIVRHASAQSWASVSQRESSVGDPSFLQRRPTPTNYGIRYVISAHHQLSVT